MKGETRMANGENRSQALAMDASSPLSSASPAFACARIHADEAMRLGRLAAEQAILCGIELIRLQEEYGTNQGQRTSSHSERKLNWQDLVEQEVGIAYSTAARWMQAARAQLPAICGKLGIFSDTQGGPMEALATVIERRTLQQTVSLLSGGKTLEQLLLPLDASGAFDPKRLVGKARDAYTKVLALSEPFDAGVARNIGFSRDEYEQYHDDAVVMRERVESGQIPPARAWAGLRGRAATEGQQRAAVDHRVNLETALLKLNNSLRKWDALDAEDRAHIEGMWQELWEQRLPGSWKATGKKVEGWK